MFLVEGESLVGCEPVCLGQIIDMINASENVDDILGLFGKGGDRVDEVAPAMSQAVCKDGFESSRQIPAQRIAHLDGRWQLSNPSGEEVLEVFPGVVRAGEKAGDGLLFRSGDDGGGEHPLSLGVLKLLLLHEGEDLDGGVVVVEDLSLCRRAEQLFIDGSNRGGGRIHDFPLGRGGQGHAKAFLQLFETVEGQARPIFHEGHQGANGGIIFGSGCFRRWRSGEDLPAEVAAKFFELKGMGLDERGGKQAEEKARSTHFVDFPFEAFRATIAMV